MGRKKKKASRSPNKSGSHSKQKGAAFERAMAQRLSLWISEAKSKDLLWRSAMSGGRYTMHRRTDGLGAENSAGDISAQHPDGFLFLELFTVECKFYADLKMVLPIFGSLGQWPTIWYKPLEEARSVGKEPFVIAKQNRQDPLLLTTKRGLEMLRAGCRKTRGLFGVRAVYGVHPEYKNAGEPAYVLSFNEVMTLSSFKRMFKRAQE